MKSNGTNTEIYEIKSKGEREREREREHSVSETRWWPCDGRSRVKSEELKVELT